MHLCKERRSTYELSSWGGVRLSHRAWGGVVAGCWALRHGEFTVMWGRRH